MFVIMLHTHFHKVTSLLRTHHLQYVAVITLKLSSQQSAAGYYLEKVHLVFDFCGVLLGVCKRICNK